MLSLRYPGLSTESARQRLEAVGPNILQEKKPRAWVGIFLEQISSPLVWVLLIAAGITLLVGDQLDTVVILVAVCVNTILGFFQEYKAEHALFRLKKMLSPTSRVVRDGMVTPIAATLIVPDDMVLLAPGDRIPADGVLVEAVNFSVNEAVMTGESMPVGKTIAGSDNSCMMGTVVVSGRGIMRVVTTGMQTKLGSLARTLEETAEEQTPLQKELARLANRLAVFVLASCIVLFAIGMLIGESFVSMLTTAVAIAVSAIPEGMVVSLTVILALGMQRIMKKHAIVRRLVAAETLGSVTTICVDKTGTITQGTMKVVKEDLANPEQAIMAAALANDLSEPLEVALWDWVLTKDHLDPQQLSEQEKRLGEIPFDARYKYMAVETQKGIWIKGAPEVLLELSTCSLRERGRWMEKIHEFAREGLRTLAFGFLPSKKGKLRTGDIEKISFLGLVGISDPVRPGVAAAIARVKAAGINVKIITGDYRDTAQSVLRSIGIALLHPEEEIIEGKELDHISDALLRERVGHLELFCRVTPEQKHRIVGALQSIGEVVAMTGDGVNDAPALKKADIGIVVVGASDVARDTADLVLLDSNFETIVGAVEEGRGMFENIRKVVLYLLSDAFVEMSLILFSILLRLPLPLIPLQILWINLIDDGLPSLALTADPPDHDLMRLRPRPKNASIIDPYVRTLIILISAFTVVFVLGVYIYVLKTGFSLAYGRTLVFAMVGIDSLIYVFSCRAMRRSIFQEGIKNRFLVGAVLVGIVLQITAIYHPWAQKAFETVPIGRNGWVAAIGVGILLLGMIEGVKFVFMRSKNNT